MFLGRKGKYLFVNSAHGMGRDHLEELFPIDADGSIELSTLCELVKEEGEVIEIGELVLGRVAIRKAIEEIGVDSRGKPYTKRRANDLFNQADFVKYIGSRGRCRIPYTTISSLESFVQGWCDHARSAHIEQLDRARKIAAEL